ncbi:hypothetical protein NLU13_2071 [Sarocladium strictum]|uniref:Uncharacterized protein n=1 Tax=Sarocladium strictum TaxID=5046 RepID=A0AA39GSZ2_SARSR|nr:hypothetical protein NLU13_2071 [Sarocladium strictum]
MASQAAPSTSTRIKQEGDTTELYWQPDIDGRLMQLFYLDGCWDMASIDKSFELEVLTKLQSLEALIPAFEARINRSDHGFDAWKRLHQFEMNAGRAQFIQMFVKMVKWDKDGTVKKVLWADQKWEVRYAWIVRQREELARIRFSHLEQLGLFPDHEGFFGPQVERPSRIRAKKDRKKEIKGGAKRINQKWSVPVDERLMEAAGGPGTRKPILPESRITKPDEVSELKFGSGQEEVPMLGSEADKENTVQVKFEEDDQMWS